MWTYLVVWFFQKKRWKKTWFIFFLDYTGGCFERFEKSCSFVNFTYFPFFMLFHFFAITIIVVLRRGSSHIKYALYINFQAKKDSYLLKLLDNPLRSAHRDNAPVKPVFFLDFRLDLFCFPKKRGAKWWPTKFRKEWKITRIRALPYFTSTYIHIIIQLN